MSRRKHSRRKHVRAGVDWPVNVVAGKVTLKGSIKDISRGGALLYLKEKLDIHEHIRLGIEIPEFDDVIFAKGEVVRSFSVKTDRYVGSFGVGVKFTEISNEDLRYFTGNLAPEWREGYEESVLFPTRRHYFKPILYCMTIFLLISITLYALRLGNGDQLVKEQIVELNSRITVLEKQITAFRAIESSGVNLENQVQEVQDQLVIMQNKLSSFATVDKVQSQANYFKEKIVEINNSVEHLREAEDNFTPGNQKNSDLVYYFVKKEDNLYRIGLKHGINVDKIRELNRIAKNESIYPGQKLIVGWK